MIVGQNWQTPLQQVKAAGLTSRGQKTQGLPQPVSNVRVSVGKSGATRTLRVSFTQNPNDAYFASAKLYVKQGNGSAAMLASGTSPIIVTIPQSNSPVVVTVVSSGNWGDTPLSTSPSAVVSLA